MCLILSVNIVVKILEFFQEMLKFVGLKKKYKPNNTKNMTTKTICGVKHNYVSPDFEVLEIKAEGVLCTSGEGDISINPWTPDGDSVDF